jgi:speckle-type POZ protein
MGDQQVGKETAETKLLGILPPPSKVSHWCEVQHEVIKVDIEWIIPQFSLLDAFKNWDCVSSTLFSHQESFHHWKLNLSDMGPNLGIQLRDPLINSDDSKCHDPTRVTIAISNKRREKIFPQQHCLPKNTNLPYTVFQIEKKFLIESECLVNDKLTIYCEIEEYFYNPPLDGEDYRPGEIPFGNRSQLLYNLQDLFKNMKYSDIIVNVRGREFKAHKNILAARSSYFAAMFDHPTKENLSNQIEIDDIEPGVFHEILRYIYTGQVSEMAMEKKVLS